MTNAAVCITNPAIKRPNDIFEIFLLPVNKKIKYPAKDAITKSKETVKYKEPSRTDILAEIIIVSSNYPTKLIFGASS